MARLLYVVVAVAVFFAVLELTRPTFRVHESGAILITGASTGIGKHVALHLVSLGYDVFASVRKEADGEALAKEAGSVRMHPIVLDVTKSDQIDAAVKTLTSFTQQKNVPLVGLVNNAGVTTGGPVEFTDIDAVKKMYDVNVFGLVELTQKLLPLIRTHQGRIVNVGSVAGKIGMPSTGHYASSKFAVEGLTDALRRELVGLGVSVSIIEPAYVSTAIGPKGEDKFKGYSQEQKDLYNLDALEAKREKSFKMADSAEVTTDVITDALVAARPHPRYVCANAMGIPAWVTVRLHWLLPDTIFDAITRAF